MERLKEKFSSSLGTPKPAIPDTLEELFCRYLLPLVSQLHGPQSCGSSCFPHALVFRKLGLYVQESWCFKNGG